LKLLIAAVHVDLGWLLTRGWTARTQRVVQHKRAQPAGIQGSALSFGRCNTRRAVHKRATESGSQTAPHAEQKSTVVGEDAGPQKLAFCFWYLRTRVTRLP
jgi:hypothetical protein